MISVQKISKRFGTQVVLEDVDLEIARGEMIAIVGPSGVGKSVLMKIIMGILTPESGEVQLFGEVISQMISETTKNRIRSKLGVLFQAAALFDSLTIYDNIAFPLQVRGKHTRKEIHQKIQNLAESLELLDYLSLYSEEISPGIRKRAGLARALITDPELVLFDEPNTGLDPFVGQEVYDLIQETRDRCGYTGIVISHELPEVFQVVDRVAMLSNGKFVFDGSPEEMMEFPDERVQQFLHGRIDGPIQIQ